MLQVVGREFIYRCSMRQFSVALITAGAGLIGLSTRIVSPYWSESESYADEDGNAAPGATAPRPKPTVNTVQRYGVKMFPRRQYTVRILEYNVCCPKDSPAPAPYRCCPP